MRIKIFSTGLRSHLHTDIVLVKRLRRDGHDVIVYACRDSGATIAATNAVPVQIYDRNKLAALFTRWQRDDATPDLVLTHAELHREQLHSLAADYPTVALETQASPDQVAGVAPLSSPGLPGAMPRLTAAIAWRRLYRQRNANPAFRRQVESLRQLANQLALDFESLATFRHWHPIRFRSVPCICLSALAFDFPTRDERPTPFVGPVIELDRGETVDQDLRSWLEDCARGPLIYCSLGSLQADRHALLKVVAAAALRPDWRWVLGTLALSDAEQAALRGHPKHVRILNDVPQSKLLEHADAMITGAGIASIYECVLTETPMLAHSLGVLDQNGNAARVAFHDLGVRIDLLKSTPAAVCRQLDRLLLGSQFKAALKNMHAACKRDIESDVAVKTLVSLV